MPWSRVRPGASHSKCWRRRRRSGSPSRHVLRPPQWAASESPSRRRKPGVPPAALPPFDARPLASHPLGHLLPVPLEGPLVRPLAREAHGPQGPRQRVDVVGDAAEAADELADAGAGPQVRAEAAGAGALQQTLAQLELLSGRKLAGASRRRLGTQGGFASLPIGLPPSADAGGGGPNNVGDLCPGAAIFKKRNRSMPPRLQFLRRPLGSHTPYYRLIRGLLWKSRAQ